MSTRLDNLRVELAHQQSADRLNSARRCLDRLQDELDRLAGPWPSAATLKRRGVLTVAVRNAEQHLCELLAVQKVERSLGLEPVLEVTDSTSAPAWRPGYPKPWRIDGHKEPQTWRLGPPSASPQRRRPARAGGRGR